MSVMCGLSKSAPDTPASRHCPFVVGGRCLNCHHPFFLATVEDPPNTLRMNKDEAGFALAVFAALNMVVMCSGSLTRVMNLGPILARRGWREP